MQRSCRNWIMPKYCEQSLSYALIWVHFKTKTKQKKLFFLTLQHLSPALSMRSSDLTRDPTCPTLTAYTDSRFTTSTLPPDNFNNNNKARPRTAETVTKGGKQPLFETTQSLSQPALPSNSQNAESFPSRGLQIKIKIKTTKAATQWKGQLYSKKWRGWIECRSCKKCVMD